MLANPVITEPGTLVRSVARLLPVNMLLLAGLLCSVTGLAQQNGRFATLRMQAMEAFDRGQFDQVAGRLEEIWEQDRTDPRVAEYLAMGYLYGEHNVDKARPVMKEAIARGGQATFLIQHSHGKMAFLQGDPMNNYCSGKMSISPGTIAFISEQTDHSAKIEAAELKEFKVLGGVPGRIEIKAGNQKWTFRVRSGTMSEANLLEEIAEQNLRKK